MKSVENKLDSQVEIWAFLGPALILITFFVLLVKASVTPLTIPLFALVGMPLCWKWKVKGLTCSLVCLFLLVLYQDQFTPTEERLWNIGLAVSLALAFVVTALSFEEASSCLKVIQTESSTRLTNILQMDDKLQEMRRIFETEKEQLLIHLANRDATIQEKETQLQAQHKLNALLQHELSHHHAHREKIENELFNNRSLLTLAQDRMEALEKTVAFDGSAGRFEVNEIQKLEIEELRQKLQESAQEIELTHRHVKMLSKDLDSEREMKEENRKFLELAQQEQIRHRNMQQEMNDHLETAHREKHLLESSLTRLQQCLEMLRSQESEKDQLIESYISTIKGLQAVSEQGEGLLNLERERVEQLHSQYQIQEESYLEQLTLIEEKWLGAIQELSRLQSSTQSIELEERLKDVESLLEQERRIVEHSNREIRRLNGVYQQLRDQFDEKSRLLDDSRKELFLAQEELTLAHLIQRERELDRNAETIALERHLTGMEHEVLELVEDRDQEIEQLSELVTNLIQTEAPSKKTRKRSKEE